MKSLYRLILAAAMMCAFVGAATAAETDVKIMVRDNAPLGAYLTDANGMTLYWKKHDTPRKSTCSGQCIQNWPPAMLPSTMTVPAKLKPSDFGTMTRDDGRKQSTFRGYPLYYYIMDKAPGDTFGQGLNGEFYVVNPDTFPHVDSSKIFAKP